jgi:hypothetical protein
MNHARRSAASAFFNGLLGRTQLMNLIKNKVRGSWFIKDALTAIAFEHANDASVARIQNLVD